MDIFRLAIANIIGIIPLLFLPSLLTYFQWLVLLLIVLGIRFISNKKIKFISWIILSFLWANAYALFIFDKQNHYIPLKLYQVKGCISHALVSSPHSISFLINSIDGKNLYPWEKFSLLTFWPKNSAEKENILFNAGQCWQMDVKFKPIHSNLNEGGFDKQRYFIQHQQIWAAKVNSAILIKNDITYRQFFIRLIEDKLQKQVHSDILLALLFGERSQIDIEKKELFKVTGVAHLMAISGLHIIFIALISWHFCHFIQWFLPIQWIKYSMPWIGAWLAVLLYTWLAGGNPPALRAFSAFTFYLYCKFRGINIPLWCQLLLVASLLLFLNPLMVLSDSYWLSIYAVASLIFWFRYYPLSKRFQLKRYFIIQLIHMQIGLFLLMIPIQIYFFSGISMNSLVTNILAVPVVSFITLPLLFFYAFIVQWFFYGSDFFAYLANLSIDLLFNFLSNLSEGWISISSNYLLLSTIPIIFLINIKLIYLCHHLNRLILVIILLRTFSADPFIWRVDFLDVGHGLAIVIRQGNEAILYDTASSWEGGSYAQQVIAPFLIEQNLTLIGIIISHQDNDHVGGLSYIKKKYPKTWVRSPSLSLPSFSCEKGTQWQWLELNFEVFWPEDKVYHAKNNDSCVIRINDNQFSLLLTGDIEKTKEFALIEQLRRFNKEDEIRSTILQIPHHGSRTSSSLAFLKYISPELAIASNASFTSRELPAEQVKMNYGLLNIPHYSTSNEGQITIKFYKTNWVVSHYRVSIQPRWYHRKFGTLSKTG